MAIKPLNMARKGALAYVGAIALASDQATRTFSELVERGTKAQQATRKQFMQAARSLRGDVREVVAEGQEQVAEAGNVLARGRDRLFDALNIPTHEEVLKLNMQIDRLSSELDSLRKQTRRQRTELAAVAIGAEPLPGYEKLNAEAVIDRLPMLEMPALAAIRAYEQEHGNRITVLRAVERTMVERQATSGNLAEPAGRTTVEPLPRYDELTVEEVGERLNGLSAAELLHVQVYEQEHANRVTVLRAVEDKLNAKSEA